MMKGKPDAVAQERSRKLDPKKDGVFKALQVKIHTATVVVDETHNFLIFDRITLAKTTAKAMQATEVKRHNDVPWKAGKTGDECVVERIVRHPDDKKGFKYLVRWHGYSPTNDT